MSDLLRHSLNQQGNLIFKHFDLTFSKDYYIAQNPQYPSLLKNEGIGILKITKNDLIHIGRSNGITIKDNLLKCHAPDKSK